MEAREMKRHRPEINSRDALAETITLILVCHGVGENGVGEGATWYWSIIICPTRFDVCILHNYCTLG
ncbi:hypothetical protein Y032_0036g3170 [Ancylostoma ceylanicum]|uniref:Uncharacterized protein n=1 Tax=Ancylostoma ceylanicum TaxID=53326 RepID=A0A016UJD9_9BILA|nr:hypothetical protein Y032_0036g3170 [Ancylostoma ceylanicum]